MVLLLASVCATNGQRQQRRTRHGRRPGRAALAVSAVGRNSAGLSRSSFAQIAVRLSLVALCSMAIPHSEEQASAPMRGGWPQGLGAATVETTRSQHATARRNTARSCNRHGRCPARRRQACPRYGKPCLESRCLAVWLLRIEGSPAPSAQLGSGPLATARTSRQREDATSFWCHPRRCVGCSRPALASIRASYSLTEHWPASPCDGRLAPIGTDALVLRLHFAEKGISTCQTVTSHAALTSPCWTESLSSASTTTQTQRRPDQPRA